MPDKKKFWKTWWFVHGIILTAMVVACCFELSLITFWNFGYAVYAVFCLIRLCLRNLQGTALKICIGILLGFFGCQLAVIMCIPSWLICVAYSMSHPEYAENLPVYETRGFRLRNAAYYRDYNQSLFEGDIGENELKKAAVQRGWKFEEIAKPFLGGFYTAKTMIESHKNKSSPKTVPVESGLIYDSHNGTDRGETVVWDRKAGRLYYLYTSR